jgi:hypothetical protein
MPGCAGCGCVELGPSLNKELKKPNKLQREAGEHREYSSCKPYWMDLRGFVFCFPARVKYLPQIPKSPDPPHCPPMLLRSEQLV